MQRRVAHGPHSLEEGRAEDSSRYHSGEAEYKGHSSKMKRKFGAQDSLLERIWKYRGIIVVVSIPILLVILVISLWPSGEVDNPWLNSNGTATMTGSGAGKEMYSVVFDAGSTGSRVHVYEFGKTASGTVLKDELFEQLKPGLSSYAEDPASGAKSLLPLLESASKRVPRQYSSTTKISLRATAGLRMLPGDQAEKILLEVSKLFAQFPFKVSEDSISIMDGADEGAFAWVTVNYLLGNLGKSEKETVGVIDLGGGSTQIMFAVPQETASRAPKGYIRTTSGGGRTYNLYVNSYLGYGLMAARVAILEENGEGPNPCIPADFSGEYKYSGKILPVSGDSSIGSDFSKCKLITMSALHSEKPCEVDSGCGFNGFWGGDVGSLQPKFYMMSYLYERAEQARAVPFPEKEGMASAKPTDILAAAQEVCKLSSSDVKSKYPEAPDPPYFCMDLTYYYVLLTSGFNIEAEAKYQLVKKLPYKGNDVEVAWSLGLAVSQI